MLIADSHEFIELYRGDKDVRIGMEMVRLDSEVRFVSFAPDRLSPTDQDRFGAERVSEVGLPDLPDRMEVRLMPSRSVRFARKESGGIMSIMPGYGRALRALRPDVVFENPFSWLTPRSYQTYRACKRLRVPFVYYDPGDDIPITRKHRVMATWERRVVNTAAAIVTYNEAGKRRFEDKYGYPSERIHVIPKPVDVGRARHEGDTSEVRRSFGAAPDDLVVAYVGRLTEYKGSAMLLEVARRAADEPALASVRFVFVGGALASAHTEEAYRRENTYVTGMVPHEVVPEMMAAADVLVFPDVTRPGGFPTAVAEAMAAGRALVVGIGSHTEFLPLEHECTALLTKPSDSDDLARAILRLAGDRRLVETLGREVGQYAQGHMDYPVVASRYLEILRTAVHSSSTRV